MKKQDQLTLKISKNSTIKISKGSGWSTDQIVQFKMNEKFKVQLDMHSGEFYLKIRKQNIDFPLLYLMKKGILTKDEYNSYGIKILNSKCIMKNRGHVVEEFNQNIIFLNQITNNEVVKLFYSLSDIDIRPIGEFDMHTIEKELEIILPYRKGETLPIYTLVETQKINIGI